jgi:hypothetical protein
MGVVMAADGAGLAGGMLAIMPAGVGPPDPGSVAAAPPGGAAVGPGVADVADGVALPGAGVADAVRGVRVGRGLGEPVGTGVAAGGVASTPVTAGVGESAPGVGMEDEGTGVGVTLVSNGTLNEYTALLLTSTADGPLCCSTTAEGCTVSATSGRALPSSVPQADASIPGHTWLTVVLLRT